MPCKLQLQLLVFVFGVGISRQCVIWKIVNPPIIFGETATLGCVAKQNNGTSERSWHDGPDGIPLVVNGISQDDSKYREVTSVSPFESMLQIFKFSENDVDCYYTCTIGLVEYKHRLELDATKFVYMPNTDSTVVKTSLSEGVLSAQVTLEKVYPRPICSAVFKEKNINEKLSTTSGKNGKLFKIILMLYHKTDECKGDLLIKCWVGKTAVTFVNTRFDKCLDESVKPADKEKQIFTPVSNKFISIIGVSVAAIIVFLVMIVACISIARYQSLRQIFCCYVNWRGEDSGLGNIPLMVQELYLHQTQGSVPNDPEENN